jgi:hypothetical protein
VAVVVGLCVVLRALGFAATAVGRNLGGAIPFMYALPLIGIAFGIYATTRGQHREVPQFVFNAWEEFEARARRSLKMASSREGNAP